MKRKKKEPQKEIVRKVYEELLRRTNICLILYLFTWKLKIKYD